MQIEINKINAKLNKLMYMGLSILDIRKTAIYDHWYDYVKPKNGK